MVKVLLLEDDPAYRRLIERVIRRNFTYEITSVATEMQAWEKLSTEEFDLVLLDLNIDGRRCWETLKRAVEHPGKPVPIVFSCEDTKGNADHALSHGAYTFLAKPFNFVLLKATIDAALAAKHQGTPGTPEIPEGGDAPPIASPEGGRARSGDGEKGDFPGAAPESDAGGANSPAYFRVRLNEEIVRTLRYNRHLTLALLALDDPEEPGKTRRAPPGDPPPVYVLRAFRNTFRRTDIFAPCGWNEFAVLMPETRSDQILARISGFRDRLQRDLIAREAEMTGVSVWVGMASLPTGPSAKSTIRHVRSPDDFFRMARLALFQARLNDTSPVAVFDA
jgi:CheY-like chemotaxis protein/GGDEF domain-containing protein